MKPDIVYIVRPGDSNEELRYSLRSLANLPHGKVWVAGYRPSWLHKSVRGIPVEPTGDKWANARANRRAACEHPKVSDEFALFNDDFFVLRPVDVVPNAHRGSVAEVLADSYTRTGRSAYLDGMRGTRDWLVAQGIEEPLSYELHIPILVRKEDLAKTLVAAEASGVVLPHIRTIYGNLHSTGADLHEDCKIVDFHRTPATDSTWVSTNDKAFRVGAVGAYIRGLFPEPSPYEVAS